MFFKKIKNAFQNEPQHPLILESGVNTHYNGFRTCVYYSDWSIYDRKHFPEDIPLELVTNIFYAFFNVDPNSGKVELSDQWADTDIEFKSPYTHKSIHGLLARFFEIKQHNRQIKISMSIGGWSNGDNFKKGTNSALKLQKFVESSLELMVQYGFDGIDLDWEYPETKKEAGLLLQIMKQLRLGLREIEDERGLERDSYLLTIASPAFEEKLENFQIQAMDKYLSFWNLMTYDFAGEWSEKTGYHCNLYKKHPDELCADDSVKYFLSKGIDPSKLTLGMANYGRSFTKTNGYGRPFNGVGTGSSDEAGIWNYNKLPLPGATEEYDHESVIAFSYDSRNQIFVSYDNIHSVFQKAKYVVDKRLGGGMWWESCGDRYNDEEKSLIHNFVHGLGGKDKLDSSNNTIEGYSSSEYLKQNFGDHL
ncbi:glycoside hydrolase family 18 protein [Wickerhamomyces anomalus NRRL Y-366-8]|uniref:chitinase n=1 Tax=Wickerhamomyces anomalus (strain ATCC 58044 / CBS 1984 / NCYC 433 / NRRL Y-366-8) TaxID=683960 RepID=A0A1E3P7S2_WICAA|nr:glycoside hydrolase family 18 protein [Wickerhamomyces anomalus NRRL Y-366-8]ODQ61360.1 glycoside hydrolase family 18 protein [Wickerhamomyces anomalus NRRL Y-366-8]